MTCRRNSLVFRVFGDSDVSEFMLSTGPMVLEIGIEVLVAGFRDARREIMRSSELTDVLEDGVQKRALC